MFEIKDCGNLESKYRVFVTIEEEVLRRVFVK